MAIDFENDLFLMMSLNDFTPRTGLILIPDISGFTRFVQNTDLTTGREITYELLSVIIDQNELLLSIAEIEGDAVFFYKNGPPPSASDLVRQYMKMLHAFRIRRDEINKIFGINCDLSLKMIAHYGPIAEYDLRGFKKLYGKTVVEAHALLKNDISSHSYALLTEDLMERVPQVGLDDLPEGIVQSHSVCHPNGETTNVSYTYYDFTDDKQAI